jgi:hypothetical protein
MKNVLRKSIIAAGVTALVLQVAALCFSGIYGLDLFTPYYLGMAVLGFLAFRRVKLVDTMPWVWIWPTLPVWFLALVYGWYSAAGAYVYFQAKPTPPELARPPITAEQAAAVEDLDRRFPSGKTPDTEMAGLLQDLGKMSPKTPGPTWDELLADPDLPRKLGGVRQQLDEVHADFEGIRPARKTVNPGDSYSFLHVRQGMVKADLVMIRYLARDEKTREEARKRYERLLRISVFQMEECANLVTFLVEVTVAAQELALLESVDPGFFTPESAARQGELIGQIRERSETAFKTGMRGEMEFFEWIANQHMGVNEFRQLAWDTEPASPLAQHFSKKMAFFPFHVRKDSIWRYANTISTLYQACDLPPAEGDKLVDRHMEIIFQPWAPNPYGRVMHKIAVPVYSTVWQRAESLESRAAAHENGLRWQVTGSTDGFADDPMTGKPFVIVESGPETLVLGGGHPDIGRPSSSEEPELKELGLEGKALYVLRLRRTPVPERSGDL